MIRKLVRQMLSAQIFSALAVSLCLLIDIVVIGRFLGDTAMAAYQLANPMLLLIGAIGTLLSALRRAPESQYRSCQGYH